MLSTFLWTLLGLLCGALPFSVWVGKLSLRRDIRAYGDGNPGAFNVIRAGGRWSAVLAILLEFCKGALPVTLAQTYGGVSGWSLVPVALAPLLGHAYSPFLNFRGGKALAVTFGIWFGLTFWHAPVVLGLFFILLSLTIAVSGWAVLLGMLGLGAFLLALNSSPILLVIWLCNFLLLAWKYRTDLALRPSLTPRAQRLLHLK